MGGQPTSEEQAKARLAALQPTQQQINERLAAAKHAQDLIDQAKNDPAVQAKNDEIRANNEKTTNQIALGTLAFLGGAVAMQGLSDPANPKGPGSVLDGILNMFGLGGPKAPAQQFAGLNPIVPSGPSV